MQKQRLAQASDFLKQSVLNPNKTELRFKIKKVVVYLFSIGGKISCLTLALYAPKLLIL